MIKKRLSILLMVGLLGFVCVSCGSNDEGAFETKEVEFYREKEKVDRKVKLRFYNDTPSVPYVGVKQYFNEFYKTNIETIQDDYNFKFVVNNFYIKLDTKGEIFTIYGVDGFSIHPEFRSETSTIFLKEVEEKATTKVSRVIDLNNYSISTYKSSVE